MSTTTEEKITIGIVVTVASLITIILALMFCIATRVCG